MQEHFNGELEIRMRPKAISMEEQLQHVADYEVWKARGNKEDAHRDPSKLHGCKTVRGRVSYLHYLIGK